VIFSQTVNQSSGSFSAYQAVTDLNGDAKVTYTAGDKTGTDTVQARVASIALDPVTTDIAVDAIAIVNAIEITTGGTQITADGTSTLQVRAKVSDVNGSAVAGQTVSFSASLGGLSAATATTDSLGYASVTLTSTSTTGKSVVTASTNGFNDQVTIDFVAGTPNTLTLSAISTSVAPGGIATLTATVTDSNGNRVSGETVNFSVSTNTSGGTLTSVQVVTNSNGDATVEYKAGSIVGSDVLEARAASSTIAKSTLTLKIQVESVVIGAIQIESGGTTLVADGSSKLLVRARVIDSNGVAVSNYDVDFNTTLGNFVELNGAVEPTAKSVTKATDSEGYAQTYISTNDGAGGAVGLGTARIDVNAGGISGSVSIEFVADSASSVIWQSSSTAAAPIEISPNSTVTLSVVVQDANSNVVTGEQVRFDIIKGAGTLSSLSVQTDVNGRATVTYQPGTQVVGTEIQIKAVATSTGVASIAYLQVAATEVHVGAVTITTGASEIMADGASSAIVRVLVVDQSGLGISGQTIVLTTTLGTLRTLDGTVISSTTPVVTNTSGVAEVYLWTKSVSDLPVPAGSALVTASAGGYVRSVSIDFVAGPASKVNITAAPETIQPNSSTTVTVQVLDSNDNPVVGETVNLVVSDNKTGGSLSQSSVVTNGSGLITFSYTSGTLPSGSSSTTDVLQVTISSTGLKSTIGIEVDSAATLIGGVSVVTGSTAVKVSSATSGTEGSTLLRAAVVDINGQLVSGVDVVFTSTLGTLFDVDTGTELPTGFPVSTVDGYAQVRLRTLNKSTGLVESVGTAQITAYVKGFTGSAQVAFTAADPYTVSLGAQPAIATPSSDVALIATVSDRYGNPVVGDTVRFSISTNLSGGTLGSVSSQTDANGQAMVTYTTGDKADVSDSLKATVNSNGISQSLSLSVKATTTGYVIGSLTLASGAENVVADGSSLVQVRAQVLATDGAAVPGISVVFATTLGSLVDSSNVTASSAQTDTNGYAYLYLKASTTAGTALVTASASGFIDTKEIPFVAGMPTAISVLLSPTTVNPLATVQVRATITDANNNPVSGEEVRFSSGSTNASGGSFTTPVAVSNQNGIATAIYEAGDLVSSGFDKLKIVVSRNGLTKEVDLTISSTSSVAVVNNVEMVLGAASIIADNSATNLVKVRAIVTDSSGNTVSGVAVNFTTSLGSFYDRTNGTSLGADESVDTNSQGIAELYLRSTTKVGTARVVAESNGFYGVDYVKFVAGLPASISIKASPTTTTPGGEVKLTTSLLDGNSNPISGETVIFSVYSNKSGGSLQSITAVSGVDGLATTTYIAGTTNNTTDSFTARADSNGIAPSALATVSVSGAQLINGISVSSGSTELVANGSSSTGLRAQVVDINGDPAPDGTEVTFALSNPSLGTLSTTSPVATVNGIANVTLTSTKALGTLKVTALAGGFEASLQMEMIAGSPTGVTVVTAPTTAAPYTTIEVRALVIAADNGGNHPVVGEVVNFDFDSPDVHNGEFQTSSAVTNAQGVATIYVDSNDVFASTGTDSVVINAVVASNQSVKGSATYTLKATQALVGEITAETGADSLAISEETVITAVVYDLQGRVLQGQTVTFSSNAGALGSSSVVSDKYGVARSTFTATEVGTAKITVSSNGLSDFVTVQMVAGAPDGLTISALPSSVTPGSQAKFVAKVVDDAGRPVVGETVIFSIYSNPSGGNFTDSVSAVTNANGEATVAYTTGTNSAASVIDKVSARVASNGVANILGDEGALVVELDAQVIGDMVMTVANSTLVADGNTTTMLRVTVLDTDGVPIAGQQVLFNTSKGKLLKDLSSTNSTNNVSGAVTTDSFGRATVYLLTSSDNSVTPHTAATTGYALVSANVGGFTASGSVEFTAGAVGAISLTAASSSVVRGNELVLKARLFDINGLVIPNANVIFEVTNDNSGGSLSSLSATTDVNGYAYVTYTAGLTVAVDEIVARAKDDVSVESSALSVNVTLPTPPDELVLAVSQYNIKSDNSDISTITATALDANGAVIEGVEVTFTVTNSGQISAALGVTDESGQATVNVSSGTALRENRRLRVIATVGSMTREATLYVIGSSTTVVLSGNSLEVAAGNDSYADLRVYAQDAGGNNVPNATVTFSLTSVGGGLIELLDTDGNVLSSNSGIIDPRLGYFQGQVHALAAGSVVLTTTALTQESVDPEAIVTKTILITRSEEAFKIESINPTSTVIGTPTTVSVAVPGSASATEVTFSSSVGYWTESTASTYTVTVPASASKTTITAHLQSDNAAGTATVQVDSSDGRSDVAYVDIAASCDDAAQVIIQANRTSLPISTDTLTHEAAITARVLSSYLSGQQPVSGCKVQFSIEQAAGGGEAISPVLATSDSKGLVEATLTSGLLGSSTQGVRVVVTVLSGDATAHPNAPITDSIDITITDQAGSVEIGHGTEIADYNAATYSLPMSVLVTNAAGQAVTGAKVYLSTWPERILTGIWYPFTKPDGSVICVVQHSASFGNEDDSYGLGDGRYRNLILDAGEDRAIYEYDQTDSDGTAGVDLNYDGEWEASSNSYTLLATQKDVFDAYPADGIMTPHSTAGGAVPEYVTTDDNGVAAFELVYLKQFSEWIYNDVIATTEVEGTEVRSILRFILPASVLEAEGCLLNDSPFNPVDIDLPPGYVYPTAVAATSVASVSASSPQSVTLNGSASVDGTSPIISYYWEQVGGSEAVYILGSTNNNGIASFTSPSYYDSTNPELRFRLTVRDGNGATGISEVSVLVTP